jgi:tRNA(fMet)-specific endonuclease VapC
MLHCLDTSVIIDILRGDESLKSKIASVAPEHLCITPLILAELFKGVYLAQRQAEALRLVEEFVHSTEILEFNEHACRIFGQRYGELVKQGKQPPEMDLMIASVVIAHNAVLITRNPKDFTNIKGLKVLVW